MDTSEKVTSCRPSQQLVTEKETSRLLMISKQKAQFTTALQLITYPTCSKLAGKDHHNFFWNEKKKKSENQFRDLDSNQLTPYEATTLRWRIRSALGFEAKNTAGIARWNQQALSHTIHATN